MFRLGLALGISQSVWLFVAGERQPVASELQPRSTSAPNTVSESHRTAILTETHGTITLLDDRGVYLVVHNLDPSERTVRLRLSSADETQSAEVAWHPVAELTLNRQRTSPGLPIQTVSLTKRTTPAKHVAEKPASETTRVFYLHVTDHKLEDPLGYVPVFAEPFLASESVTIYRDRLAPKTDALQKLAEQTLAVMEAEILPRSESLIGSPSDVDGDGKLSILLTPWLNRLQGGRTSINGYVRGSDFQLGLPKPLSNHADLIYLNSEMKPETHLQTLLGHEYVHLLAFSIRMCQSPTPLPIEEDWLSEAESHLAENLLGGDGSNLRHRIEAFLSAPGGTPLVVDDYYRKGLWRDDRCRGATYLFIRWLADVYGEEILPELLQSNASGVRNIEQVTGERFETLLQHWGLALIAANDDEVRGEHGYRYFDTERGATSFGTESLGQLRIESPNFTASDPQFELASTGTIFVKLDRDAPRQIQISVYPQSKLQVTLIPIEPLP